MSKIFRFQRFSLHFSESEMHPMGTDSWLLGATAPLLPHCHNMLDIGTGSGIVALMLAQRTEHAYQDAPNIHAIDVSPQAIAVAHVNFQNSPWGEKLKAICGNLCEYVAHEKYELIVCNPPYYTEHTLSGKETRHLARHESNLPIPQLIKSVKTLLSAQGIFVAIAPPAYMRQLIELGALSKLYCNKITEVYATKQSNTPIRVLNQFSHDPSFFCRDKIVIYQQANNYTDEIKYMLKGFFIEFP